MAPWRTLRVLIVDDEQDMTVRLFARVGHWGHDSRMAYHGQAALFAAADQHPDVVLLNLELPSMDGRRLARQLRLDAPRTDCFIIALADWADDERRRQCSEAGIDLLLVNPLDPSVLEVLLELECVRVNRRSARQAVAT
jgi:DNA-binding response OmpR family regulator